MKLVLAQHNCTVLQGIVKGASLLCTCKKKECNKLDLTGSRCFWLVHHNDWSRWFSVSRCDDSANMMKMHWLVEILRAFSHVIYKRQNSMVNEITLWSNMTKGHWLIDYFIEKPKFFNYNFFSLTKVILNLIIFAPLVRNFVKWPTCTPCCQGLPNDTKSIVRGLMVWEC